MDADTATSGSDCFDLNLLRSVRTLLSTTTLATWLARRPPRAVFTIHDDVTCARALQLFASKHLAAAPLLHGESFISWVELSDILKAVLSWYGVDDVNVSCSQRLQAAGTKLRTYCLRDIACSDDGQLLHSANIDSSLQEVVVDGFLKPSDGGAPCHRIGVFDRLPRGGAGPTSVRVTSVVTQIDVIRFLHEHAPQFEALAAQPLSALGLAYKPVVCVPSDMPAVHAFAAAAASHVSVVGVVDPKEHGALAGSLSVHDFASLRPEALAVLALPVAAFLQQQAAAPQALHGEASAVYGLKKPHRPAAPPSVRPDAPLREVLRLAAEGGAHAVFVADAAGRPVGVVTLGDVLRLVAGA